MKKINYLLHNVTIINFPLMGKLVLRYRIVTAIAMIVMVALVPYFFYGQPVVHQKEVYFKIHHPMQFGGKEKAAGMGTFELLPFGINLPEVMGIIGGYDFRMRLASFLVSSPNYSRLDLRHPIYDVSSEALQKCADKNCRINAIREIISDLYTVNQDASRFSLKIASRNKLTTFEILQGFQRVLEEVRIENASSLLKKQIDQLQEQILKSKTDLEAKGGFEKVASAEFLDAIIAQHKEKISVLTSLLIKDDSTFFYQRTRLKESGLAAGTTIAGDEKLSYEKYVKINRRNEELRQNIAAINSTTPQERTVSDVAVLTSLKEELTANEHELKQLGDVKRNVKRDNSFINTQKGNQSSFEFDYKVSSAQVKKLRSQYDEATAELDELYGRKASLENELVTLKPDLEFLKMLEARMVSLKFEQSSVTSDVIFEPYGTEVYAFKRNSLAKIAGFCFVLISFLMFISYLVMYIIDDRIFEELEVKKCMDELPVIGHAPYFD